MDRLRVLGLGALLLTACEEKRRNAPLTDQTASITVVSAADGGQATNAMMIGDTDAFPLPSGDEPALGRLPELRERGVYLVRLQDGSYRPAYLGTVSLFFGPLLTAEEARQPVTFGSGAAIGWADPSLRPKILQVARERAAGEVPALLAAVADDPGPEWREAYLALPEDERATVRRALAPALTGAAPKRLLAAALVSDLSLSSEAAAARVADAPDDAHLAAAILLAAVPGGGPRASLACSVLGRLAALPHGDPLLAAALAALRREPGAVKPKAPPCVDLVKTIVARDGCEVDARCVAGTLVSRSGSPQDEPTCTKEETLEAADREAQRSKWELADRPTAPTTALALAVLYDAHVTPPGFAVAHARRRYAITAPGDAAAVREESHLRDAACKGQTTADGVRFVIDDASRKLRVTAR